MRDVPLETVSVRFVYIGVRFWHIGETCLSVKGTDVSQYVLKSQESTEW